MRPSATDSEGSVGVLRDTEDRHPVGFVFVMGRVDDTEICKVDSLLKWEILREEALNRIAGKTCNCIEYVYRWPAN